MRNVSTRSALRSMTALALALCLLLSAMPLGLAAQKAGHSSVMLSASETKSYIRLSRSVLFFTGEKYGDGEMVQPPVGAVCQLLTEDWYTGEDNLEYYSVFYNSKRYNVLRTDVASDILTPAQLETYIVGTLWKQTTYTTLRQSMDLVADVRVHAVQLALKRLGYYKDNLDGSYGEKTARAVKQFQRDNKLEADGSAGPLTQPVLFALASGASGTTNGNTSAGTVASTGKLQTTSSVNLREKASKSSPRLAVVPGKTTLNYYATRTISGVTWYQVDFGGLDGWLMGTFVKVTSSSGATSGSTSNLSVIGTVTITEPSTRVRKTPGGEKSGYVLSKGAVVDMVGQSVSEGGYTWHHIRTKSGLVGYVRGDCATANPTTSGGTTGGTTTVIPSTNGPAFVRLPTALTMTRADGSHVATVPQGTVLMLASKDTFTENGTVYCNLYYNNETFICVYSDVSAGLMTAAEVTAHVNTLLSGALPYSLKDESDLVGDVYVYALQVALNNLGYYRNTLDGQYGSGTQSAVRNFQRKSKIEVDGACGTQTWDTLRKTLGYVVDSGSGGTTGSTGTGGTLVTDFGTINKIVKADWNYDDNGGSLFPKGTYATVMDVQTGKVFRIYRWSGASHADCVPATLNDTKIMCDIVGYTFDGTHPNSSQLAQIKGDSANGHANYTWPDFNNTWGSGKDIGSAWDRRPALVNIDGVVYATSIYGYPHGFNGTDSFAKSRFPNGGYFYSTNCYYGMMCVHFVGSKTHSGTSPDTDHQNAVNQAYEYAKSKWPDLCK